MMIKFHNQILIAFKACYSTFYYTIAFPTDSWCELFLKVPFGKHVVHRIFYVYALLGLLKKMEYVSVILCLGLMFVILKNKPYYVLQKVGFMLQTVTIMLYLSNVRFTIAKTMHFI